MTVYTDKTSMMQSQMHHGQHPMMYYHHPLKQNPTGYSQNSQPMMYRVGYQGKTDGGYSSQNVYRVKTDTMHDIVDTAVNAGQFNTLVSAIKAADLVSTLKGEGPFTVFAPTDEAFAKIPKAKLESLLADKGLGKNKSSHLACLVAQLLCYGKGYIE